MLPKRPSAGSVVTAIACLVIATETPAAAFFQQPGATRKSRDKRAPARKSAGRSSRRPMAANEERSVADRIVLRDGKELSGQVDESPQEAGLTILARRELVRTTLPGQAKTWEDAEREVTTAALRQQRERLAAWRVERRQVAGPEDRIMAWLDRRLAESPETISPSPLMAIRLGRGDVSAVERRSESAARALRQAWLMGLPDPETTPPARLKDAIAARGIGLEGDEPIAIDRLLPPAAEKPDRWLLRRAATEVLHDDGLRFIRFGNTMQTEPVPGQPIDPSAAVTLVEGTIRDVLGVGGGDPLPPRLRDAAMRGRVGLMVTSISIAPDLGSASAESTLYFRNGSEWGRALWRSQNLEVGAVPPVVLSMVANDPQVKAVMNLIDAIGAGFVSPALKERGLVVGTTVGGAVVLARTALVRSLMGLAFDVEGKTPARSPRTTP
jgi:hypothetical protein